jgi:hypothetical protein
MRLRPNAIGQPVKSASAARIEPVDEFRERDAAEDFPLPRLCIAGDNAGNACAAGVSHISEIATE